MMDTSETYIKMCERAEEIQNVWGPKEGDFVSVKSPKWRGNHIETVLKEGLRGILITSREWEEDDFLDEDITIWLPRQDQLQEMVGGFETGFIDWWHWRNAVYPHMQNPFTKEWRFNSFEQLWLAFVMKEKYNKVWNGEDWE